MKPISTIIVCLLLPLAASANQTDCENTHVLKKNAFICAAESRADATTPRKDSDIAKQIAHSLIESIAKSGRRYDFIDEGEGIGIAEIAPTGSPSLFDELSDAEHYSALELYLSLKEDHTEIPSKLLEDHLQFAQKAGRSDNAPKKLSLNVDATLFARSSVDEGYDPNHCNYSDNMHPGNSEFTWAWFWSIGVNKDFTAQQTYFPSDLNGTTGKRWYAGKSRARWLGACNGNYIYGFPAFEFRAEYKSYSGQWKAAFITQVEPYYWVRYSSFSNPERWRVRLKEIGYNVFLGREYAVAVAGNEPLEFEAGF